GGKVYTSNPGIVKVDVIPDLATYQTAATDIQLPAPGLPISLSRSYDSKRTDGEGALGKGWNASWDEASVTIASPLSSDWVEAGRFGIGLNQYNIAETTSHLVTI